MTGLDVLNNLGSAAVGAAATLVAVRMTRSIEFEKERRRRIQDFLERLGDAFDNYVAAVERVASSAMAVHSAKEFKNPEVDKSTSKTLAESLNAKAVSKEKLSGFVSRSLLYGFNEFEAALDETTRKIETDSLQIIQLINQGQIHQIQVPLAESSSCAAQFRRTLQKAHESI